MKKLLLPSFLLFISFLNFNCFKSKSCTPKTVASEVGSLDAYCAGNGITPTVDPTGLYYQILDPGTGISPTANSKVFITYTGKLVNGTVFDQQSNSSLTGYVLSRLIDGWRVGIPKIKVGGHILLVVPSVMGYGCDQYGVIPANSILFFDITLVDVQN
ncbi:MAG TPA: FKBP-type peptidyl-prolyl cis-trans isomerase [Chitinophagaceae bacterium]|nr:FKBP-type peptidyl-prolyl cis-trans isomerase [Chitinophagaceae bacterium]